MINSINHLYLYLKEFEIGIQEIIFIFPFSPNLLKINQVLCAEHHPQF